MRLKTLALLVLVSLAVAIPAAADSRPETPPGYYSIAWPTDIGGWATIQKIDTLTGAGTILSVLQLPTQPDPSLPDLIPSPFGVAFDDDGTMYTINNWIGFDPALSFSRFAKVNPLTGEPTFIGPLYAINFAGPAIDGCGDLYVTGFTAGDPATGHEPPFVFGDSYLYRFNKRTGEAVRIGDTGNARWMDLAFDSKGRLWATTDNELWRLDPETGAATFVTSIHGVPQSDVPGVCPEDWPFMEVMSIAFDARDVLWATAMRGFSVCIDNNSPVMRIDTATGVATVVGYTNNQAYNHGGEIVPARNRVCRGRN